MQFIRFVNKIKIYALLIILLNSSISITCKNISQPQKKNSPSKDQKVSEPGTLLHLLQKDSNSRIGKDAKTNEANENNEDDFSFLQKSEVKISSKLKNKTIGNSEQFLAVKLLCDLGKFIINKYTEDSISFGYSKCMGKLKENICQFDQSLTEFWQEMKNLSSPKCDEEFTKIEIFQNVFTKLNDIEFNTIDGKVAKCGEILQLKKEIKKKDLILVTGKDIFFGRLATIKQQPFIDSMFSVYREKLSDNAFGNLNKSSFGKPSFIINSAGLTEIATSGLVKEHTVKSSAYSNANEDQSEESQNSKGEVYYDGNNIVVRSEKITVLNGNQIEFPGVPGKYPEGIEVPGNPSMGGRNLVVNRKIFYPKQLENQVQNLNLANTSVSKIGVNENGQNEMVVHMDREEAEKNQNNSNKRKSKKNLRKNLKKEDQKESGDEDDSDSPN